jgi:hypothetical protein
MLSVVMLRVIVPSVVEHLKVLHLGWLRPQSQTLDLGVLWLLCSLLNYGHKKFYNIDPSWKFGMRNVGGGLTVVSHFDLLLLYLQIYKCSLQ